MCKHRLGDEGGKQFTLLNQAFSLPPFWNGLLDAETIPIQGQTVCLVCNDLAGGERSSKGQVPLGIVSCRIAGRSFFQQAFSLPLDWNGLLFGVWGSLEQKNGLSYRSACGAD